MNILKLLNNKKKILVIGELILDKYVYGASDRISSEIPIPVFKSKSHNYKLGGAANVAKNISNYGMGVAILTILDQGVSFGLAMNLLKKNNIYTGHIISDPKYTTPIKTRYFDGLYQCFRNDHEKKYNIEENIISKLMSNFRQNFKKYDYIVISDYNNGFLIKNFVEYVIDTAYNNNIPVLVDPKKDNYYKFTNSYLIKPNKKDAEFFCNFKINNNVDLIRASKHFCNKLKTTICLITLSDEGISYYNNDTQMHHIFPTKKKLDVIDVTGAGDTVMSTICLGLANNLNFEEICSLSNEFASNVIIKQGTHVVDLYFFIKRNKLIDNLNQLKILSTYLRKKNKKIVFTTGCFDILHRGHIKSLKKAKEKGDVLVVALNSDKSIKKNKGVNRPIQKLNSRLSILMELLCVDFIIIFDEKIPTSIHDILNPNLFVKGGDYSYKDILKIYPKINEFFNVELEEDFSTTNIIKKIKNL
jgi:D-beta-D-heptose 7-phosphate kinase / D-beta-D-heptose 1-phosphate adenosyltransferase